MSGMMQGYIQQFIQYIEIERGFSPRTIHAYSHDLQQFDVFLEQHQIASLETVTKTDLRDFLSELAQKGIQKPNAEITRARKLSALKSFFKYLYREGIASHNPAQEIETPKIPEKEPCYLTQEEYQRLLHTLQWESTPYYHARNIAIVTTFLGTGIRLSELVGLSLQSINLRDQWVKVVGKGNKERTIPFNATVGIALANHLRHRPSIDSSALFLSRLRRRLSTGAVYHLIKTSVAKASINKDRIGVHSLRHTFGTSLVNKNVNLIVIQRLLGHKKLETTRKYLHINNVELRQAVEQLVLD